MPDTQVNVRRATQADVDAIVELNRGIARELEKVELDATLLRRGVAELIGSLEKGFYVVAEVEGKVVGVLMVRYEWSPRRFATFWWVDNVFVDPDWRRKGVYTAMHHYLEAESRATEGVCGIRLYTGMDNETARSTYRRLGMKGTQDEVFEIEYGGTGG